MCHTCGGTSLMFPISLAALELDWQIPHLSTPLWMSSLIPGQNTDSQAFSIHFFHSLLSFVYLLQGFPSQSGRHENSGTLGYNSIFDGQVFPIDPVHVELLWKLPLLTRPSIQNVVHQQPECSYPSWFPHDPNY